VELKKVIIVLGITITVIFSLMIGLSYAWYQYSNAESNVSGTTIKERPTIIFSQTEFINYNINTPIYDEDRYNYANKNSFTVSLPENLKNYQTAIEINLENIKMSEELKIANYKYELLQNGLVVGTGNFTKVDSSNSINLMPMTVLTPTSYPGIYIYELYIWLSEDDSNQNSLMNKEFSANINVNSAIKR